MVVAASSPVFVGRDDALRRALDHLRPGSPAGLRLVLVSGEAGIGKSRFLAELRAVLEAGASDATTLTVLGRGMELAGGAIPYAPLIEILDDLADHVPARIREQARQLGLDLSGSPRDGPGGRVLEYERAARFGRFRELLTKAGRASHLVILLDDLHWADTSTLDALQFLLHRLRSEPIRFVLSYRSDAVHRRHPLHPWLRSLDRTLSIERIELQPLGDDAVREQVSAIAGHVPDPTVLATIVDRAEGNPFYVEELLAHARTSLPPSLRDVLLDRVDAMGASTQALLQVASVVGREWDERLLIAATGRDPADVRGAIRDAVAANVAEPADDADHYQFRHALLREAIYDDLLPADRIDAHRRIADALMRDRSMAVGGAAAATAELAHHLDHGHRPAAAFSAYLDAARAAETASAWAEARQAYERALELVEEPAVDAVVDELVERTDLYRDAGWASFLSGRPKHAVAMMRRAVETAQGRGELGSTVRALSDLGYAAAEVGDWSEAEAATSAAVALMPEGTSVERLIAVHLVGGLAMQFGRNLEAVRTLAGIEAFAETDRTPEVRRLVIQSLSVRGAANAGLGRGRVSLAELDAAHALIAADTDPDTIGHVHINRAATLGYLGQWEASLDTVEEGLRAAAPLGVDESWRPWLCPIAADACIWLGRLDDAERYLADADADLLATARQASYRSSLIYAVRAVRGDAGAPGEAARLADETEAANLPDLIASLRRSAADGWLWHGRPDLARDQVRRGLDAMRGSDDGVVIASLLASGIRADADLARAGAAQGSSIGPIVEELEDWTSRLAAIADGTYADGAEPARLPNLLLQLARPEAIRARGHLDPDAWAAAATTSVSAGLPIHGAYARIRHAETLVLLGDRQAAAASLRRARDLLVPVGPTRLTELIGDLARRARLPLDEVADTTAVPKPTPAEPRPWGLSSRELEVLALVADGRTNREIGAALFISEKTASVHVTHILYKLGVSSRTEAALLAARAGVIGVTADDADVRPA